MILALCSAGCDCAPCVLLTPDPLDGKITHLMEEKRITIDQVRHVARLARLELSAAEEQSLQSDLSAILSYVDKLNQLKTEEVEPTAQVGEPGTLMRDDEITNRPAPEEMLANAPARSDNLFKVPRIIE
jgi:aspartyl-tRNA(Asn)/glutamyl-tRNA(Gln) amidotransferase subunit C